MDAKEILQSLQNHSTRSYSGRGMYGKSCYGVVGSLSEILEDIVNTARDSIINGETEEKEATYEALTELMNFSTDTMGRSDIIVYWPSIKHDGSDDGEDEEED